MVFGTNMMHGYPVMQVVQYHIPPQLVPPQYLAHNLATTSASRPSGGVRKYVFWCSACGGLSTLLGGMFLAVYFILRSYTSTLGYFETIPTFIPATMLILTGLCVISLARRRNRYSYLMVLQIKISWLCCLVCALTCVLVTITTTVIHMNRLQTLRECVYTQISRTCTCYSVLLAAQKNGDEGTSFIFDSTPDCEVIHGTLYTCLRAMFGLSVTGILLCIFSSMLIYQLLSHEKKKMYWEQLELRCRSFYQPPEPSSTDGTTSRCLHNCCEECRYSPRTPWLVPEPFWSPGNFYSPNPEEIPQEPRSGWSWRRFPLWRSGGDTNETPTSGTDSQYGFGAGRSSGGQSDSYSVGGVYVWGPPPPYSDPNSPARRLMHHHHNAPISSHLNKITHQPEIHHHCHNNNNNQADTSESTDTGTERRPHPHQPIRKSKRRVSDDPPSQPIENEYHEADASSSTNQEECRYLPRLQGVENAAFQTQEAVPKTEPTESEVYFADVSSCCNISVKNDSLLYDEAVMRRNGENPSSTTTTTSEIMRKEISQSSISSSLATPSTDISDVTITPTNEERGFLAPDAQYDIINEANNNRHGASTVKFSYQRRLGANISSLIQNLESSGGEEIIMQNNISGSDNGTLDSGWQSENNPELGMVSVHHHATADN